MLDRFARVLIDPPLNRAGRALARLGVSANAVTVLGLGIGLLCVPALLVERYDLALACIAANRLCDGLDGAVARARGLSDFGGYLDIVGDMLFYAAVVFGFALARPENAVPAAMLLFAFMGTSASFLAWAIVAAKRGLETSAQGRKSFFYSAGLVEGTETILFLVAFCLFPAHFPLLATICAVLCAITVAGRIVAAARDFRG
ncbi:MAG: CDP-alcohol phosphatidyltransferase family protein [Reyranellaceae bacterium]